MITFQFLFTVFIIEGVQTLLHVIKWKTALVCHTLVTVQTAVLL